MVSFGCALGQLAPDDFGPERAGRFEDGSYSANKLDRTGRRDSGA